MYIPPKRLLFSGGGMRLISCIGVLQVLEEQSLLKHVKEFCGVSAGAFVAFMLSLGYSLKTIKRFCFEYDFSNVRTLEPETMLEFTETFGLDCGTQLQALLEKVLKHKNLPPKTTFKDLPNLRVWASDLQNSCLIEFSSTKTPNIEVVFALRASMAFPIYFIPLKHPQTGHLLADGGIYDNYPIMSLTSEEQQDTLGIVFEWAKLPLEIQDITKYISLLFTGYYMPSYQALIKQHRNKTIVIPCGEFPTLHFEATVQEKEALVTCGRKATLKFLKNPNTYKSRRYSVS
jgi:predicted acylesterase/phospholipase RssA